MPNFAITVTSQWMWWPVNSPVSRLFAQSFVEAKIKENIKAPRHWPLSGIHRSPLDSPHKGSITRKMFSFDDVIMACIHIYRVLEQYQELSPPINCLYICSISFRIKWAEDNIGFIQIAHICRHIASVCKIYIFKWSVLILNANDLPWPVTSSALSQYKDRLSKYKISTVNINGRETVLYL